ncbi:variable surface protein, partial [Plasmodium gonderi]
MIWNAKTRLHLYEFMKNEELKNFYKIFEKGCYNDQGSWHFCAQLEKSETIDENVKNIYYKFQAMKSRLQNSPYEFMLKEKNTDKFCIYLKYWFY